MSSRFRSAGLTVRFRRLFSGCLVLAFLTGNAWPAEGHQEGSIEFDERFTLAALGELTRERHPDAAWLDARQATAVAERSFADRWFPDSTQLSAFHLSDQPLDDTGMYENEVALSLPLWMPGERKSQSKLAEAMSSSAVSGEAELRWRVSAAVRRALWSLLISKRQWELALEQEARLSEVLDQATIFAAAGDLSRGDRLAVVQELAIWKAETLNLEAEYRDSVRNYQSLTGANVVPAAYIEALNPLHEIGDDHPALLQARDEVEALSAALEVVRKGNSFRPSLQLFWRGTRPDDYARQISAMGVGFEMPLGRSPRRGPEVSLANEALARAQGNLVRLKRQLDLDLHEAEHLLYTTQRQLENSEMMLDAASQRYEMDRLALELGEISTREWLRRLSEFKDIERSHELLLLQQHAAVAAHNQAVGELL
jgi:cobalt-zinc-cadmium efflux system outer membrane protein